MTDNVLARYYNGRNVLSQGPPASGYDKLADLVSSATGFHRQGTTTNALARGLDLATLGMLTGAYDGGREIADTGRPGALAMALMPGAKVARPAVEAAETATRQGIRAFHGSPHDFDRFDLSKIGSGEGAQAYGNGLYFAENESIARWYRDTLAGRDSKRSSQWMANDGSVMDANNPKDLAGIVLKQNDNDVTKAMSELNVNLQRVKAQKTGLQKFIKTPVERQHEEAIAALRDNSFRPVKQGRMYEVRINAEPDDFLDWDRPLSQQPEQARAVLEPKLADAAYDKDAPVGQILRRELLKDGAERSLREAGVPGVKYFDAGSRASAQGSRNYVVFDDALIEIMRKYGLLPPLAAGGLGAVSQSDPAMASP